MRKHGFDPRNAYSGHYVGLSVHDVGDWNLPFAEGMVLAIEPIIYLPEQKLHVRIEDTLLVTATGVEILSAAAPKEVEALLALLKRQVVSAAVHASECSVLRSCSGSVQSSLFGSSRFGTGPTLMSLRTGVDCSRLCQV